MGGLRQWDAGTSGLETGHPMRRLCGIATGVATHAVFFFTVYELFGFLAGTTPAARDGSLAVDCLLALQFAVIHSALLLPRVKQRLTRLVPPAFYGCFYCLATCLSLLVIFSAWRTSPVFVWRLERTARAAVQCGFIGSWVATFYSLSLTGLGYQTGFTSWWSWLRGRPQPARRFEPRGAYRLLRHPVYLCFLGLLWCNPALSLDHALLTGIWTVYIFVGSYLKDRRLVYYVARPIGNISSRCPAFPAWSWDRWPVYG